MSTETSIGIVVIEDNADNLWALEAHIRREGARFLNARASGSLFFKWLNENPSVDVGIILLDIQIPREDEYTILKQIRNHPQLRNTRVIAVTSNVTDKDVQRCLEAGFDGFIGKPILPSRFPGQLRRVLNGELVWE